MILSVSHCAKRGTPTGGAKDSLPPVLIRATPPLNTTLFDEEKITLVFDEYIKHFGEYEGIKEFHKNYSCLKIKETCEGFEIPSPIKFERENVNEQAQRDKPVDSI